MAKKAPPVRQQAGRVADARGRRVTQLDPITMLLLRQHDVIEANVLRAISRAPGVEITGRERVFLAMEVIGALLVIGLFTYETFIGGISDAPFAKSASLVFLCSIPFFAWYGIRRARFRKVTAAMLKHRRCPHCGYDLRFLPPDPADRATVCPECGCAWLLDDAKIIAGDGGDVSGAADVRRSPRDEGNRND